MKARAVRRARTAFVPVAVMAVAAMAAAALPGIAAAADMDAVNHAASIASGVVVGSAAPSLGVGAVLQTLVGLAVVIGLVLGCAWLARRFGLQSPRGAGALKVVASVAVGGKERTTVVEIGDTWLVLGVGPGNVRLLHTLPAGSASVAAPPSSGGGGGSGGGTPLAGTFGQRFRDALVGESAKRFGRPGSKDR